ncbi:acyl-CoA dehydrogenase family protein [Paralimibaculum aggregatum]|uniref:Acyl-CoA dehydrogenase family protein n=1 Tax=Paralimibaculum aggregatum TaxID=3036245 RepID=A0ABQ6LQX6_9RHOB|nr:acyl-CoA dehydrogenase family protein [Limibaculum sp. NKW23]GMG83504.1 acyl-CoA dehydrogenase family protein [Limibaculum sp. NKW23]
MDLDLSPGEAAFRDEVRAWLAAALPARIRDKVRAQKRLTKADHEAWHALLAGRGWLCLHWPRALGGAGFTPVQKHIFEAEMVAADAPRIVPFGPNMLGPVLIEFGTAAQKAHCLPRILSGADWWCQGYSEPGAGSDLASLATRAVREGDHYIVNGQKTWTTLGHHANAMFALVRTDPAAPKPQQGISFLLIDMASPGVEVRPIVTLDGEHEVNEVWLTDVRVPVENLVGRENDGWTVAKYLLGFERTGLAGTAFSRQGFEHLKRIARIEQADGRPLAEDPAFSLRMAEVEIDLMAMDVFNLRMVSAANAGEAIGPEASLIKIKGTELRQRITDLLRRAVGPYAMPFVPEAFDEGYNDAPIGPGHAAPLARQYFNMRKLSIYGGSNEIQKNIVAKTMLGL